MFTSASQEVKSCWMWKKPPTCSRKQVDGGNIVEGKKRRAMKNLSARETLLKEFSCQICSDVMTSPFTTPCAHNFCKACLEDAFAGQRFTRHRTCEGRRTLRAQKKIMKCPPCSNDIAEFLQNPQSDESSKEIDGSHEDTDVALDDTEMFSANSQILEEAEHNSLKSGMGVKPLQTDKFKNAIAGNGKSSCQERPLHEQPDVEKGEIEGSFVKPEVAENKGLQANAAESKLKRTNKRKKSSNVQPTEFL
ncbi:hypothetical protein CRYUN_Cryun06bG0101100 [Craigia yunnanensis]